MSPQQKKREALQSFGLSKEKLTSLKPFYITYLDNFASYLQVEKDMSVHTLRSYLGDIVDFFIFLQKEGCSPLKADTLILRAFFTQISGVNFARTEKDNDQQATSQSKKETKPKAKKKPVTVVTGQTQRRSLSARSQARKLSSIKVFYKLLIKRGKLKESPATMKAPKFYKSLPAFIPAKEMDALTEPSTLHELNRPEPLVIRDRAIIETLYSTGMRISELLSLTVTNIKGYDGSIVSELKITGKGNKNRIVFFGESARQSITQYLAHRHQLNATTGSLFVNARGGPLTDRGVRDILKHYERPANMQRPLYPHRFRHSFATDLLNEGADIRQVQEMLGHKSLSTTQIYTSVSKERLRQVYRQSHPRARPVANSLPLPAR